MEFQISGTAALPFPGSLPWRPAIPCGIMGRAISWHWGALVSNGLADLLQRIARRDEDALRELYERLHADVHRIAQALIHDYHAAQDVQQETFLKIWRNAGSVREAALSEASARAWILTIARHAAIDYLAKNARDVVLADPPERRTPSPETENVLRLHVYALIERLPPDLAAAVVLHSVGGFTLEETARLLDVSEVTVKRRCRRGLAQLRGIIDQLPERPSFLSPDKEDPRHGEAD